MGSTLTVVVVVAVVVVVKEDEEDRVADIVVVDVGKAKQGKTKFSQEQRDRGWAEIPKFASSPLQALQSAFTKPMQMPTGERSKNPNATGKYNGHAQANHPQALNILHPWCADAMGGKIGSIHIRTQLQPCAGGAYGSSPLFMGPHTDGTCAVGEKGVSST